MKHVLPDDADWIEVWQGIMALRDSAVAAGDRSAAAARDTSSRPSLPLAGYAGVYHDAWYGDVEIALAEGGG